MENSHLTDKEEELIEVIRNYRNSRHNPSQELEWYAIKLFENLLYDNED